MRLLLIGDSHIEYGNWPALLPDHEPLNYGCAGETTGELLARSPAILRSSGPVQGVVVMCGTNDLLMEAFGFLADYGRLLGFYRQHLPELPLLATSLLPCRVPWLADSTVPRLNELLAALCSEQQSTYVDLYPHFLDPAARPNPELFTTDGVHLSPAGYQAWAAILAPCLANIQS